ncbi:outer membrane beta-barrel protein [Roseateles saccharophilus]|uniref:Putative beta-barrel porin 2 n=1 Tax=Roseateles saccharophilus TaxID=304 RepID=A0A4R3UMZ2_ROSSA|nr:outer membrane beta-barrel protein [Roseateles saccharophilus]MDG0833410.1 hypothetical protein [Roseateles saccharophilus]TCU93065.1 putative beta-barrel porin 2 [Roseateles saccharophilus]
MPIKPPCFFPRRTLLAALTAAAALSQPAQAQTDDSAPFYVGGSLGVSHVSNIYRQSDATNSDTVVSAGVLGGIDHRFGRQHLKVDGSLQDNRYRTNSTLNNQSHSLSAALDWQTVGDLSGTLSAKSDRSLADFNIGSGIDPIFKKNTESNDAYDAVARLGLATRYSIEAGWAYRRRDFSAEEYDRFEFHQNTASLGLYATPAGNVRLGLVGRHTKGQYPRYPVGVTIDPQTLKLVVVSAVNDFTRDDLDFTTRWSTGGSSTLDTRISRSRTSNSLNALSGFSGTTGAIGWNWQATAKMLLNLQYSRDTGQESQVRAADVNRLYTTWQVGGSYALSGKLSLNASASANRNHRSGNPGVNVFDTFENNQFYNLGLRWAFSRSFSLGCQYDHASRDSSVPQYVYRASSFGCTGQAILY